MSYALVVAGDARADLARLDVWLQEELWDELDMVAANPQVLPAVAPGASIIYAAVRATGGVRHYLVLAINRNDEARTVTLLGVEHIPLAAS